MYMLKILLVYLYSLQDEMHHKLVPLNLILYIFYAVLNIWIGFIPTYCTGMYQYKTTKVTPTCFS